MLPPARKLVQLHSNETPATTRTQYPWSVPTLWLSFRSNTSFANVSRSPALSSGAPVSVVATLVACSMTVMVLPPLCSGLLWGLAHAVTAITSAATVPTANKTASVRFMVVLLVGSASAYPTGPGRSSGRRPAGRPPNRLHVLLRHRPPSIPLVRLARRRGRHRSRSIAAVPPVVLLHRQPSMPRPARLLRHPHCFEGLSRLRIEPHSRQAPAPNSSTRPIG